MDAGVGRWLFGKWYGLSRRRKKSRIVRIGAFYHFALKLNFALDDGFAIFFFFIRLRPHPVTHFNMNEHCGLYMKVISSSLIPLGFYSVIPQQLNIRLGGIPVPLQTTLICAALHLDSYCDIAPTPGTRKTVYAEEQRMPRARSSRRHYLPITPGI